MSSPRCSKGDDGAPAASQVRARRIEANLPLVHHVVRRVLAGRAPRGIEYDDLIQEGAIGLMQAVDHFDPSRGFQFSTYAVFWIRRAVLRALVSQSRPIRLPYYLEDRLARYGCAVDRLRQETGAEPRTAELAAALGEPPREVARSRDLAEFARRVGRCVSLEEFAAERGGSGDGSRRLPEAMVDRSGLTLDERIAARDRVDRLVADLTEPQRSVLSLRYGVGGGPPLERAEVGRRLGRSRAVVGQLERRALQKLRRIHGADCGDFFGS